MSKTSAANSHARSLAEAVILQAIEDLWNPVCKRGCQRFFEGDGFELCSEIAGISYIKQLAMLRMLAYAGPKTSLRCWYFEYRATEILARKRHALNAAAEAVKKEEMLERPMWSG